MTADRLRKVAADMRAKAEAVPPEATPWRRRDLDGSEGTCDGCAAWAPLLAAYEGPNEEDASLCGRCTPEADWQEHMTPAVALALADLLESIAGRHDFAWELGEVPELDPRALAVCDAWEATS